MNQRCPRNQDDGDNAEAERGRLIGTCDWSSLNLKLLLLGGIAFSMMCLSLKPKASLRRSSDHEVNQVPILIQSFEFSKVEDIGGWTHPQVSPLKPWTNLPRDKLVDFGDLAIHKLRRSFFQREVNPDDSKNYLIERRTDLEEMDRLKMGTRLYHNDELDLEDCQRPNWKNLYFPNCNNFHEIDISRHYPKHLATISDPHHDSYRFRYALSSKAVPGPSLLTCAML